MVHPDHTTTAEPTTVSAGISGRLGLLLVRIGDEIANRGQDAIVDRLGISARDYIALAVISVDKPRSQLELARLMGKAPALCVAVLDDLEQAGLAERVRDPDDRRRSVVSITAAGKKMLARADEVAREVERSVLDGLSTDELATFTALAQRATTQTSTIHI